MRALLRWMLLLVLLGAGAYLVAGVDFGGRTLLERIRDRPGPQGEHSTAQPQAETLEGDRLTGEDREKLDELIEKKLRDEERSRVDSPRGGPR